MFLFSQEIQLIFAHRGKTREIIGEIVRYARDLGPRPAQAYGNFEKYQSRWRTSMIEVRSAKKKEGKISGTNPAKPCE